MDTPLTAAEQGEIRHTLREPPRGRCGPAEPRAAADSPAGCGSAGLFAGEAAV